MPADLRSALERARDLPVDIDPLVPWAEGIN
jgi:hypothetical protein